MKDDLTLSTEHEYGLTKQATAVDHIEPLVAAYAAAVGGGTLDEHTLLTDLLADLHHWADARELDYDAAAGSADMHHAHETDDE